MCGKNWALPLLLFLLASPLFSQSFDEKLQEAIKPLLTLPAPQRLQLIEVLKLYRLELAGLRSDLTMTSGQLIELSKNLDAERKTHQAELEAVRNREFLVGAGGFAVGAIIAALVIFSTSR